MSQVVVILDSQEEPQAGTKRLAEQVVIVLDSSQEEPHAGAKGLAETGGAKRLCSQAVVDLTKEDGVPIPRKRARASTSEAVLIDLTLEEDALTAQLNAWNAAGAIDLTGDEEARGGVGPAPRRQLPSRPPAEVDLSGLDVLGQHRRNVRAFLASKASSLDIVELKENEHSLPGRPLFARFIQAWANARDTHVELVFHGTAEANIDSICATGLDPARRSGQARLALGKGEYFGEDAYTSVDYCKGGSKMLVFAVLTDKKGITTRGGGVTVCHKPDNQLPLFVITFKMKGAQSMGPWAMAGAMGMPPGAMGMLPGFPGGAYGFGFAAPPRRRRRR